MSRRRTAFAKRFVWWIRSPLDEGILNDAAAAILGARDFTSYVEAGPEPGGSRPEGGGARVKVQESLWYEEADLLIYRIRADRFLWKMVRRLVGTMVAAAIGQIGKGDPARWLSERSTEPARLTAPPSGLFLESVEYSSRPPHPASPRSTKVPAARRHPERGRG